LTLFTLNSGFNGIAKQEADPIRYAEEHQLLRFTIPEIMNPEPIRRPCEYCWTISSNNLIKLYVSHGEKYVSDFGDESISLICGLEPQKENELLDETNFAPRIRIWSWLTPDSEIIKKLDLK
jgi:hypothetical protein